MKKITFKDRLLYSFDNTMSKGTGALIIWLVIITAGLIMILTAIALIGKFLPQGESYPENAGFFEIAWMCLMRTMDAGTMADDEGGWPFLLLMLLVTFGGIFIFSALISILSSGLEAKLDELRKGRSTVIEEGHVVILGWSPQIFTIISELVIANKNRPSPCIVILGNKDKVEMDDEIPDKVGSTRRTRIICRSGKPVEMADLDLVSLNTARSIIILSPDSPDPDSWVIKTLLAIMNNPSRREEPYHIVAEIHDPGNLEVAKMIGRNEVQFLLGGDLVARIMAQTCLQSGLSTVYMEILNFHGDEIYFHEEPALTGVTFGEALMMYEDSTVIGLRKKDSTPILNPPMDTVIEAGTQVIAISRDDNSVRLSGTDDYNIAHDLINSPTEIASKPERIVILGWNWRTPIVIKEIQKYFSEGSTIQVVADLPKDEVEEVLSLPGMQHESVSFKKGDTTDRRILETFRLQDFEYVVIMCYSDHLDTQAADARTIVTLLHLREIEDKTGHNFSIVSEMLDIRNRELAEATRADDFVVSDSLISLMLTQLSENKYLNEVYQTLFDIRGSEIYLDPAENYVKPGVDVNFYTVVEAARQRGEAAIGYRVKALMNDASRAYGVVVNPVKSSTVNFNPGDKVITLVER